MTSQSSLPLGSGTRFGANPNITQNLFELTFLFSEFRVLIYPKVTEAKIMIKHSAVLWQPPVGGDYRKKVLYMG